jgi:hypothetical protein
MNITYKQARAHAWACGSIDASNQHERDAFPIGPDSDYNPQAVVLACHILNPEDCSVLHTADSVVLDIRLAELATQYGLDYIVAYK